jgi:hypothetical protein
MDEKKRVIREKKLRVRRELMALLRSLSEGDWDTAVYADDNEWSITDLLRHVVNAEKGMTGLISQFQAGNNPVPADFDRERYNQSIVRKSKDKSSANLMAELEENHAHFLQVLEGIEDGDWQKNGRHASLRIMSIEEVCHLIPDHEADHLQQIRTALGK